MFCYNCGTKLSQDATFCHNCGYKATMKAEADINTESENNSQLINSSQEITTEQIEYSDSDKKACSDAQDDLSNVLKENNPVTEGVKIYQKLKADYKSCPKIKDITIIPLGTIIKIKSRFFSYHITYNPMTQDISLSDLYTWISWIIVLISTIIDGLFITYLLGEEYYLLLSLCLLVECIFWIPYLIWCHKEKKEIASYINKNLENNFKVSKVPLIISAVINAVLIILGCITLAFSISDLISDLSCESNYEYNQANNKTDDTDYEIEVTTEKETFEPVDTVSSIYENAEHGFSFKYPEDWDFYDIPESIVCIGEGNHFEYNAFVEITKEYCDDYSAELLFSASLSDFKDLYSSEGIEVTSLKDVTLSGYPSRKLTCKLCNENEVNVDLIQYFYVKDSEVYYINIGTEESLFNEYETVFEAIIDSYTINVDGESSAVTYSESAARKLIDDWIKEKPIGQLNAGIDSACEDVINSEDTECYRFDLWIDGEFYTYVYANKATGEITIDRLIYDEYTEQISYAEMPIDQWYSEVYLYEKDNYNGLSNGIYTEEIDGHIALLHDLDNSLTETQERNVMSHITDAVKGTDFSVCVVITDDIGPDKSDQGVMDYADNYYEEYCDINTDGILFLINNDNGYDWISTSGSCIYTFDNAIDAIFDDIYQYIIDGNYENAIFRFTEDIKYYSTIDIANEHSIEDSKNNYDTYNVFFIYDFIGLSIDEIISAFGEPIEFTEGYGVNYAAYDGIIFNFDASGIVYGIEISADICAIGEDTFEHNRKYFIDLLGEPSEEGWGEHYNDGTYYDMYYMVYSDQETAMYIRIEMPSPDDLAYGVYVREVY